MRIDPQLRGVHMRLRLSMRKFTVDENAGGEIEIAEAFYGPGRMYLNRCDDTFTIDLESPR